MRMYDIIKKKRDGGVLSDEEINFFIGGLVRNEIPSYQVSALLMAIYFRGMTDDETAALTFAIRDFGDKPNIDIPMRVDKHSTGGVGDKTSLIVMPIVASLGLNVAKMSGRGLGHTGGTIDKLESISGFNTNIDIKELEKIVKKTGIAIVGQSGSLAPADKLLYAIRDVTATVDSIPLIVSSIMGKKLTLGDDIIVLDVKTGSGAFMKTLEQSRALARACVNIGKRAGKKVSALITDMNAPLGNAIGNSLEVIEAIETLEGNGPKDLTELSLALAAEILFLAGKGSREQCRQLAIHAIKSGAAKEKLIEMVEAQGGDKRLIYDTGLFLRAKFSREIIAMESGYISEIDAESYGRAALMLGAGRSKIGDEIDFAAGIYLSRKVGEAVRRGEVIATLQSNTNSFDEAEKLILSATKIGAKPQPRPIVYERINSENRTYNSGLRL